MQMGPFRLGTKKAPALPHSLQRTSDCVHTQNYAQAYYIDNWITRANHSLCNNTHLANIHIWVEYLSACQVRLCLCTMIVLRKCSKFWTFSFEGIQASFSHLSSSCRVSHMQSRCIWLEKLMSMWASFKFWKQTPEEKKELPGDEKFTTTFLKDQRLKWGFVNLLILAHVKCHVSAVPTNQAEQRRLWSRMENTGHSGHTNKHHLINAQPLKVSWDYISFPVLQITHVSSSVCKSHHACTVLPTRISFSRSFLSISSDYPRMTCAAPCWDRHLSCGLFDMLMTPALRVLRMWTSQIHFKSLTKPCNLQKYSEKPCYYMVWAP